MGEERKLSRIEKICDRMFAASATALGTFVIAGIADVIIAKVNGYPLVESIYGELGVDCLLAGTGAGIVYLALNPLTSSSRRQREEENKIYRKI